MPRNGSGTHSTPNTFAPGTDIQSSPVNANFSDISSEITNSLPRDGTAGMTGQLKASSGSSSLPSISFSSDTDSGFFRKTGDTIGIASGGSEVGSFGASGFTGNVTGDLTGAWAYLPAGTSMLFYQATVPTGWSSVSGLNEHAIRIVDNNTTGGATAGTRDFSSTFGDVTIAKSNLPDYNLSSSNLGISNNTSVVRGLSANITTQDGGGSPCVESITFQVSQLNITGNIPSGGSGNPLNFNVKYADMAMGVKD